MIPSACRRDAKRLSSLSDYREYLYGSLKPVQVEFLLFSRLCLIGCKPGRLKPNATRAIDASSGMMACSLPIESLPLSVY